MKNSYIDNTYKGSGTYLRRALKKYGTDNFNRETLFIYKSREKALLKEAEIVNLEFVARKNTYNIKTGGEGGCIRSEETKRRISKANQNREKNILSTKVVEQRRKDIINEPKTRGWKTKLSRKWGLTDSGAWLFLNKYALDLDQKFSDIVKQRRKDIIKEPKVLGWKTKLAKKWSMNPSAATKFIKRYIQ